MPPGCFGLDLADGTKYTGNPGTTLNVSDDHARAINKSWYGSAGVMRGDEQYAVGTKAARVCLGCRPSRRWNLWTTTCPRCGAETSTEERL